MINYLVKDNYKNRKKHGVPSKRCKIEIIITSKTAGDETFICMWEPYRKSDYPKDKQPGKGFLGTARINSGKFEGIGFHAWEQNDAEFIYYKILK